VANRKKLMDGEQNYRKQTLQISEKSAKSDTIFAQISIFLKKFLSPFITSSYEH